MIIDLLEEGSDFGFRYESEISPAAGDIILLGADLELGGARTPKFSAQVLHVTHCIRPPLPGGDLCRQDLVTCVIRRARPDTLPE